MPKTETHNAITLRPPPGTRFSIFGADVELQFPRGQEEQMLTWLQWWLDNYVKPEIEAGLRGPVDPNPEVTALKAKLEALQGKGANSTISPHEQKLAALTAPPNGQAKPSFIPAVPKPQPFANMPKPGQRVVYGPNGPMTQEEISALPDQPGPNGYASLQTPQAPSSESEPQTSSQETESNE
jgi:hypothetical protein